MRLPHRVTDLLSVQNIFDYMARKVLSAEGLYSNPIRSFSTSYQPNRLRPTFVSVSVFINTNIGAQGQIDAFVGPTTGPTIPVARVRARGLNPADGVLVGGVLPFIVPAGHFYRIVTTDLTGTPQYNLSYTAELTL